MSTGGRAAVYDPALGTLHVWSAKGNVPSDVADLIHGRANRVGHTVGAAAEALLRERRAGRVHVDLYLYTSNDSPKVQRAAVRAGATFAVHRKTAASWLRGYLSERLEQGCDVHVVLRGGDA